MGLHMGLHIDFEAHAYTYNAHWLVFSELGQLELYKMPSNRVMVPVGAEMPVM